MGNIQKVMSAIEADKLKELVISDVGAMVLPRTLIELGKRGLDAGREALFRESTGTVTNTFLTGWMGLGAQGFFNNTRLNPKAMDFRAWIDAPTLEAFGNVTQEILDKGEVKSAQELREVFLKTVLSRMKSTDNIINLPEFKAYFPGGGQLQEKEIQYLTQRYLGQVPGFPTHAHNVEERVARKMALPETRQAIRDELRAFETKFLAKNPGQDMTDIRQRMLTQLKLTEKRRLIKAQQLQLRLLETQNLKGAEKTFINQLYQYAINQGKLSDQVFLLDGEGRQLKNVGVRGTQDILEKINNYMKEFLNRALADSHTGQISATQLNTPLVKQRLFATSGKSWLQRNLLLNASDGLIPYAFKSKYFLTGLPFLSTLVVGCTMVLVNNWMTQRKYGGEKFFPGERALMQQVQGGSVK